LEGCQAASYINQGLCLPEAHYYCFCCLGVCQELLHLSWVAMLYVNIILLVPVVGVGQLRL
jgi:hypothetical protein